MLHPVSLPATYHLEPLADVVRRVWAECFPDIAYAPNDKAASAKVPGRLEDVMEAAGDVLAEAECEAYLREEGGQLWSLGTDCWRDPPRAWAMLKGSLFSAPQGTLDPALRRLHLSTVYVRRGALEALKPRLGGSRVEPTPKGSGRPCVEALRRWYTQRITEHDAMGHIPSREEDVAAARAELGEGCTHKMIRALRRDLAPEAWQRKGRPTGGAKPLR